MNEQLTTQLNRLLSTYQVFYANLRGAHWNVTGPGFFELHVKFEEMYNSANLVVDNLAERILTLKARPGRTMSQYLSNSAISEEASRMASKELVSGVLGNIEVILDLERSILDLANDLGDEGTATLISDDIAALEKEGWMMRAYLS